MRRINAEKFVGQNLLGYFELVIKRSLRPPANINRACDVFVGKVKDLFKFVPILHFLKRYGFDGRTRDDHAVELHFFDFVKALVKTYHMPYRHVRRFVGIRLDERDVDLKRRV